MKTTALYAETKPLCTFQEIAMPGIRAGWCEGAFDGKSIGH